MLNWRCLFFLLFWSLLSYPISAQNTENPYGIGTCENCSPEAYRGYDYSSFYLEMRDDVKIACDLFLPKKLEEGKKVPTIIYLVRYVRTMKAKWPLSWIKHPIFGSVGESEVEFFTKRGYAVMIVDTRGSGASFGKRAMEFSQKEIKDGKEIVDWIVAQDWSNGKVGSTGISYTGTTAELLLVNQHPAVRACIPRSNIFDLFNHMVFPGGVRQGPFVKVWQKTTEHLDNNNFTIFGKKARKYLKGINPVQSDRGGRMMAKAWKEHEENFDVFQEMFKVEYRDEEHPELHRPMEEFSIHFYKDEVENSGTPIYRIGGWYDGALQRSVIEGYLNTSNTERVLLGPWDHGPVDNASPFADSKDMKISIYNEMLKFYDYHLKGMDTDLTEDAPFYYYTVGEEKWKTTESWPLKNQKELEFYFSADSSLTIDDVAEKSGQITYQVDTTATSGETSRWNSQTSLYKNGHTNYEDRKEQSKKLLSFTAAPFETDMVMTGHPILDIYLSAKAKDLTLHCYIEDIAPDGSVTYVTEGQFRALHRKISDSGDYKKVGPYHSYLQKDAQPLKADEVARINFDMHPISYQFKKGHSLRISIGGSDLAHFDMMKNLADEFTVHFSEEYPSGVRIPIEAGESE